MFAFGGCQKELENRVEEQKSKPDEVISFVLTDANNISINAVLNETHAINMMFHTAVTSVSMTTEAIDSISLKLDKSTTVTSWGGESSARYGSGHSLRIGELVWDNLTITESKLSGHHTDGKFGYNFFKDKIIEFDYETNNLNVYSSLPKLKGYDQFQIEFENDSMFIVGSLKIGSEELENRFLIHSGFGGAVLLDDEFVAANQLINRLETIGQGQLKDSFGNVLKTKRVTLPAFSLGKYTMKNIPISIFDGAIRKQKMSVIGGDTLKRFHVLLDLQNFQLYLKPNKFFHSEFKP